MSLNKKLFWGGLGWVLGGPIGGILGYAWASMSDSGSIKGYKKNISNPNTQPGDFIVSLMVLFAKVMKADNKLLRSELNYIKDFLNKELKSSDVQYFMILFKDILKQDYPLKDVCRQIQRSMDHPSRIELIHILFGLAFADKQIDDKEIKVIHTIAGYLNINSKDYESIKAMFIKDNTYAYKILEIDPSCNDDEVKKGYRKMANKYHPDKVSHLGLDLQHIAEEKFKAVNNAYQTIKKERKI
jgi:DnaJ like chaperone protein